MVGEWDRGHRNMEEALLMLGRGTVQIGIGAVLPKSAGGEVP